MRSKIITIGLLFSLIACNNKSSIVQNGDVVELYFEIKNSEGIRLDETAINKNFKDKERLFSFRVGNNEVIKGWDSVIVGAKKNKKYTFVIPAKDAYGNERIYHDIPPNSDLILTFKVVEIIKGEKL